MPIHHVRLYFTIISVAMDYTINADVLRTAQKQVSRVDLYLNGNNMMDMISTKFTVSKDRETCETIYARVKVAFLL